MSLFFTLLPVYIFGNLHCIGMCGPLVMLLGQHKHRYWYFLGRCVAFAFAGLLAGGLGAVLHHVLSTYHVSALVSFFFGLFLMLIGLGQMGGIPYPGHQILARRMSHVSARFAQLLSKDTPKTTFLFGLGTILLPCGQTVIVFSACALEGSLWVGGLNGAAFALLTSPSLYLAMGANTWLRRWKKYQHQVMGLLSIFVGMLALLRGMAELHWLPHWVLNPASPAQYHIVLY